MSAVELEQRVKDFVSAFLKEIPPGQSATIGELLRDEAQARLKMINLDWLAWFPLYRFAPQSKLVRRAARQHRRRMREYGISLENAKYFHTGVVARENGGCVVVTNVEQSSGDTFEIHELVDA